MRIGLLWCLGLWTIAFIKGTKSISIEDFGAIADEPSIDQAKANSDAIVRALQSAHESESDKVVLVPSGQTYHVHMMSVSNLDGVTLQIEGTLVLNNNPENYPQSKCDMLHLTDSKNIRITGHGTIDGQVNDLRFQKSITNLQRISCFF